MKFVSYNLNGIRASSGKGLFDWIDKLDADILCFQEVRASSEQTQNLLGVSSCISPEGGADNQINLFGNNLFLNKYNVILNCGQVAGYAGTMIFCKQAPDRVEYGLGDADPEGRCITAYFGNLAVVNCYVPNGGSRLDFKMEYFEKLTQYLNALKQKYSVVFLSDANIAHTELDLSNPKECASRTGFLPIERAAMTKLLNCGFCDVVRKFSGDNKVYTWRSYRSRNPLMDADFGWKYRFDYILCSEDLSLNFVSMQILDLVYSDHMPIVAEIKKNFEISY